MIDSKPKKSYKVVKRWNEGTKWVPRNHELRSGYNIETLGNMKKKSVKVLISCAALVVSLMAANFGYSAPTPSAIIYDNTATYLTNFFASPNEFGDQVSFAGTQRTLTDVSFEYFASLTTPLNDTAQFRIYRNAPGASGAPTGAPLYDSGSFAIGNGFNHVDITGLSLLVPDTVTWTIQFSLSDPGETAGLPIYSPPTIGRDLGGGVIGSYDDFWQNAAGTWQLYRFPGGDPPANFAARFSAIPEASTLAYALLGGLILIGYQVYRRYQLSRP
jgi:hypothetical protein